MTDPIHARLAGRDLLPAEHVVDSGYPSAALVADSLGRWGVTLVSPLLADQSRQARSGAGYDRGGFTIDFDTQQATCPQGKTSTWWNKATQRDTDTIVIKFAADTCRPCPMREQCTRSVSPKVGRQLTVPPREVHDAQLAARATQAPRTGWVATAGVDRAARIWDPGTGECQHTPSLATPAEFALWHPLPMAPGSRRSGTRPCGSGGSVPPVALTSLRVAHALGVVVPASPSALCVAGDRGPYFLELRTA